MGEVIEAVQMSSHGTAKSAWRRTPLQSMWYANLVVETLSPHSMASSTSLGNFRPRVRLEIITRDAQQRSATRSRPVSRQVCTIFMDRGCIALQRIMAASKGPPAVNTHSGLIAVMRHPSAPANLAARCAAPWSKACVSAACRGVSSWPKPARPHAAVGYRRP